MGRSAAIRAFGAGGRGRCQDLCVLDAVIFDLDDALILEEDTARAALAEALTSAGAVAEVDRALVAIREICRASAHHSRCVALGIRIMGRTVGDLRRLSPLPRWAS